MMHDGRQHPVSNAASVPDSFMFLFAAVTLLFCAFILSCRLPGSSVALETRDVMQSTAGKIADTGRMAAGRYFYAQADTFFHRGVAHVQERALNGTFFRRLSATVTPEEHAHLSGSSIKEIMPWLTFAMQADPHNTEYAVVAAFWLASEGGRPDLAHEVLHAARIDNPTDCELIVEEGRLYVRQGGFDDARRLLDMALRRWPGRLNPTEEDALRLKREILLYTALLAEESGNRQAAAADLRIVLAMYPEMESLRKRIQNLENGTEPENSARSVLRSLIMSSDNQREACEREDHDHAGHEHDSHAHD